MMAGKVMDTGALVAQTKLGETVNTLPLAIGRFDEVEEAGTNQLADGSGIALSRHCEWPADIGLQRQGNVRTTIDSQPRKARS